MSGLVFENVYGKNAEPYLQDLACLRMRVFHDYPYLYEGSLAYEESYLRTYFDSSESLVILAKDGDALVGASTAIPLSAEAPSLRKAFIDHGLDPDPFMYFGESILLPSYRGMGAGKIFFQRRLEHTRQTRTTSGATFCSVIRQPNHPLKPLDYRPLDELWRSFGFAPETGMIGHLSWRDRGAHDDTAKPMQFWLRTSV